MTPSWMTKTRQMWLTVGLLLAVSGAALVNAFVRWHVAGEDLFSSYAGCRVVAAGQQRHLYAHDLKDFSSTGPDEVWQRLSGLKLYAGNPHPYVQTPLWAYALLPVCRHTTWSQFHWIFEAAELLAFAAMLVLITRFWAPTFLHPLTMLLTLVVLRSFLPLTYGLGLGQTHIFFVLAMIAALMLADRKRPVFAGLLLAVAAAVKITPAVLILYWLVRRQVKPAIAAGVWLALLWGVTWLVAGPQVMASYGATLNRISHTVLLSNNNQSFAAWWLGPVRAPAENPYELLALHDGLRLACSTLLAVTALLGGWLDWKRGDTSDCPAPLGGLVTMVGATIFAPIEWTHYSIVLIGPLMVLVQYARTHRARWVLAGAVAVLAMNLSPLAHNPSAPTETAFPFWRTHFYSEVLCLLVLSTFGIWQMKRVPRSRHSDETAA